MNSSTAVAEGATRSVSEHWRPRFGGWWPYAAFLLAVSVYAWRTLPDGFCASMDEGFLQSVAKRLLSGEHVYRDFDYWRTPLSVYLQAASLWVFGSHYTIMAARWFCVVQTGLAAVLLSSTYRRFVRPVELLLLLVASYALISITLTYPWYSYDAMFFAVVGLVLLFYQRYSWCGVAWALAGLAKQNYFLLLPLFLLLAVTFVLLGRRWRLISPGNAAQIALSFGIVCGAYGLYLLATGDLAEAYRQVVVWPNVVNPVSSRFAFFQDNGEAWRYAFPAVGLMLLTFWLKGYLRLVAAAGCLVVVTSLPDIFTSPIRFTHLTVVTNYALGILILFYLARRKAIDPSSPAGRLWPVFVGGVLIQYLSGFNYSGLWFSGMGAGVALPLGYVMVRELAPSVAQRRAVVAVLLVLASLTVVHRYRFVYQEPPRPYLTATFPDGKLAGVRSTPAQVAHVRRLLAAINTHSEAGDYIFTYPSYPCLYYLTDRANPTRIDWYFKLGIAGDHVTRALAPLRKHPPRVLLIGSEQLPAELTGLLGGYRQVEQIDEVRVYVPNGYTPAARGVNVE